MNYNCPRPMLLIPFDSIPHDIIFICVESTTIDARNLYMVGANVQDANGLLTFVITSRHDWIFFGIQCNNRKISESTQFEERGGAR